MSDVDELSEVLPSPARSEEELIALESGLAELPERQRVAILLREWRGLSYAEIAEQMDLSEPAVESLLFRARARWSSPSATRASVRAWRDLGWLTSLLRWVSTSGGGSKIVAGVAAASLAVAAAGGSPVSVIARHAAPAQTASAVVRARAVSRVGQVTGPRAAGARRLQRPERLTRPGRRAHKHRRCRPSDRQGRFRSPAGGGGHVSWVRSARVTAPPTVQQPAPTPSATSDPTTSASSVRPLTPPQVTVPPVTVTVPTVTVTVPTVTVQTPQIDLPGPLPSVPQVTVTTPGVTVTTPSLPVTTPTVTVPLPGQPPIVLPGL